MGVTDRAERARERVDAWFQAHPRVALASYVVVPGAAVALAMAVVSREPPRRALLSGVTFGGLYGALTYFWTDWRGG